MVAIDDIAELVTAQLAASSPVQAAVPGDVFFDRATGTPAAYPYAVFTVKSQPPDLSFDDAYVQRFEVGVAAYCPPVAQSGVDPAAVQQAFFAALASETASASLQGTPLRNATERVMHARPLPVTGQFQAQLREGRDIFVCGLTVEIMVQGDRSVA